MTSGIHEKLAPSVQAALCVADALAGRRGHAEVLAEHLLEALLGFPAATALLTRAGVDTPLLARRVGVWLDALPRVETIAVDRAVFRTAGAVRAGSVQAGPEFHQIFRDTLDLASPHRQVDWLALLLSVLAHERPTGTGLWRFFRRKRDVPPLPRHPWRTPSGASWNRIVLAVIETRNAAGFALDEHAFDAGGAGVAVVFHNDNVTTADFVTDVLMREAACRPTTALWLTWLITFRGQATVTRLPPVDANALATRVETSARAAGYPLRVTVEAAAEPAPEEPAP